MRALSTLLKLSLLLAVLFVQAGCAGTDESMVGQGDPAATSNSDMSHGWGVTPKPTQ